MTEVLGKAGVNLSAMSIADNSDFGILRCIVSDPDTAKRALEDARFTVRISDVIGFDCPNTSGSLAKVLKYLSDKGVFIEYMYSFACGNVAHIVIRPTDLDSCERILAEKKVDLLAANEPVQGCDTSRPIMPTASIRHMQKSGLPTDKRPLFCMPNTQNSTIFEEKAKKSPQNFAGKKKCSIFALAYDK